jgi:predicted transposase YbfD/YdcC
MAVGIRFETWKDSFADLPDPRVIGRTSHRLLDILFLTLCGVICGMDDWEAIEEWGCALLDWLWQFVEFPNGVPSHDTLARVFAALDSAQFEACFVRWMSALCPSLEGQILAIDGKTARGACDRGQQALHLVSPFVCGHGITLGQWKADAKSNEITAMPELIAALDLKGATVTLDAMGCQKAIAQALVDQGADHVFGLKGNQGTLHDVVKKLFDVTEWEHYTEFADWGHITEGAGQGRIERRRCVALACLPDAPFDGCMARFIGAKMQVFLGDASRKLRFQSQTGATMNPTKSIRALHCLIFMAMLAPLLCFAETAQVCEDKVVAALTTALDIGTEGEVRAASCKLWPDDKNKMLVAIAYEPPKYPDATNYQLPLYILMVNSSTLNILSSYKGSVSEDAVTHINERSLVFDTARYLLTKEVRAFGLRVYANVEPRFSEGGYDDFLSLYVVDGKQIRPVLTQLAMRHWTYQGGVPGGTTNYTTIITNFTLTIAPTTSHGFADLLISAKTVGKKKVLTHKLRYDGKFYPFDMIDLRIKLSGAE